MFLENETFEGTPCKLCGSKDFTEEFGCFSCSDCGYVEEERYITNTFEANKPLFHHRKTYQDYIQRFYDEASRNEQIRKKNEYHPIKHLQKVFRCLEGNHRIYIPHDVLPFLEKTLCSKLKKKKPKEINIKKIRKALKMYPNGTKYIVHSLYFKNELEGKYLHFPSKLKSDVEEIFQLVTKIYKEEEFPRRNIKKLPNIQFMILQILIWIHENFETNYNPSLYFEFFKNMKGKQKQINTTLMKDLLLRIHFQYALNSGYKMKTK